MRHFTRQMVTCISAVYLTALLTLAGYASSRVNILSIPIADGLTYATTALPVVSGLILGVGNILASRQERRERPPHGDVQRPPFIMIAHFLSAACLTSVITLLSTHAVSASGLDCGLQERWATLFSHKDSERIKNIQDAFKCCGLKNSKDMAWPFPDKTHDALACEKASGPTNGCLSVWKREERRMAALLMGVICLVFIWQFAIATVPTQRESWLRSIFPHRGSRMIDDETHGAGPPLTTNTPPEPPHFSDREQEDVNAGERITGSPSPFEMDERSIAGMSKRSIAEMGGEPAVELQEPSPTP